MSYDLPSKKFAIATDVDALATLLAQRQSDSGTTNGGIVATSSPTVPQLGVDALGLGLAYMKGMADAILCATGYQGLQDSSFALGSFSITSTTFADVGNGSSTGFASWTFSVPMARTYVVDVNCSAYKTASSSGTQLWFQLLVDGVAQANTPEMTTFFAANLDQKQFVFSVPVALSAGSHTIKLQARVSSGMTAAVDPSSSGRVFRVRA